MRILHVVPSYYPAVRYGGTIRSVHGLCAGLAMCGHEVQVLTTNVDGPGVSDVPLDRPVVRDDVVIRYFPVGLGRRLYRSPEMGRALDRLVPRSDLVHAHAVYLWPTWAAARAAEARGVPYLVSPRGMLVRELISKKSRLAKMLWIRLVERRTLARAAAIHVTSAAEARGLAELDLDLAPLVSVPNAVDLPAEAPTESAIASAWQDVPAGSRLLYLGRVSWKKSIDRAIAAVARLPSVTLFVAGNDEEDLIPALLQQAKSLGVSSRVRFLGAVGGEWKWALLAGADLLVVPSLNENFGIVVLEALGMGTPAVVAHGVGAAEIVTQFDLGEVTACDPEALSVAIRSLLLSPSRRLDIGQRGAAIVRKRYGWAAIAQMMAMVYSDVAKRQNRRGSLMDQPPDEQYDSK
jgi:glycosyltransferase involved in cell wall biosynthesis